MIKDLTLIVLAKNELETLQELIPKLKKISKDVILVDGHSRDETKQFCKKNKVRFFLDNKIGKGDAQRVGASKAKNNYIIFIDGDGAHDLNDIKKIYRLLKKKNDLVICSRQTGGSYDLDLDAGFSSLVRATGVIFLVILFNKLFKTRFTDILYSLKGTTKSNFKKIKTTQNGFTIEIDILICAIRKKLKILEIPSRENARKYGVSKLPTIVGIYFIYFIIKGYILRKFLK